MSTKRKKSTAAEETRVSGRPCKNILIALNEDDRRNNLRKIRKERVECDGTMQPLKSEGGAVIGYRCEQCGHGEPVEPISRPRPCKYCNGVTGHDLGCVIRQAQSDAKRAAEAGHDRTVPKWCEGVSPAWLAAYDEVRKTGAACA